jgi:pimeloyl-ACP methyl ester carboxylesterase
MDLPIYGDSYKPTGEPRIEDYAEAAVCLLDALHIERAHVAGHHTGASVAVELAAEHPERVNKLILSGCPTFSLEEGLTWMKRYKPLELTPDGWFMRHIWQFTMERIPQNQMDKAYEYDILPKLAKIKQPTLALCGDKDSLFPYHQPTLEHIPHARSHIIKGGNVQTPRLLPNEWARATLQFLKS